MKILMIGASGFLGKKMMKVLSERNEVCGTYCTKRAEGLLHLDRTNVDEVRAAVKKINSDVVVDANGIANMDECENEKEKSWKCNVEGTKNTADACKELGKKFVFISTDAVFSGESEEIYKESDEREPTNQYGKDKLSAEKYIESNLRDFLIIRPSTLYGYNGAGDKIGFANFVISSSAGKKEIKVATDQFSCPTLIDDVALALQKLLEKNQTGTFNVVGSECASKYDFALKIAEVFGQDKSKIVAAKLSEIGFKAPRPKHLNLSIEKVKSLGISMRGVDDGLREMKKQMEMKK